MLTPAALGTIFFIFAAVSITLAIKSNHYDAVFTTIIIDGHITGLSEHTDTITTDFTSYLGIDGKKQRVILDDTFSLIKLEGDMDAYYSYDKITSMASTNSFDGYMSERAYIDYFSDDEQIFLTDLNELFTQKELNQLGDALIYYTYEDGTQVPFAVDLTNTKVKTQTDLTLNNPCFGIVITAPNKKNATDFIRYAFDM